MGRGLRPNQCPVALSPATVHLRIIPQVTLPGYAASDKTKDGRERGCPEVFRNLRQSLQVLALEKVNPTDRTRLDPGRFGSPDAWIHRWAGKHLQDVKREHECCCARLAPSCEGLSRSQSPAAGSTNRPPAGSARPSGCHHVLTIAVDSNHAGADEAAIDAPGIKPAATE